MPNEMTPEEVEEELHRISRVFDTTGACSYAASILNRVACGKLAPVVHAHWHENWKHTDGRINRDCSVCHGRTDEYTPTPICPWCGALMDGKMEAIHKD